ncbi:ABC transporter substrate-binding protein [Actinoplanes sp. DH11]|uniref:substrate-binding periplasmic protein n=1 Tax=Actinoplanes sp. DH11 TaxID=2857011 RepID=UPI0027153198|nr:transporter substrate-binding domain-containing protein [Actinoplanes sp. DH11]
MARVGLLLAMVLVLAGCGWPRDAGTTLADVRGGVLRVGITENPPWTVAPGRGAEAELVKRLAAELGSRVEWYPGSESALMAALKDRVLDLVVGGLGATAPWTDTAALTRPYVTMRTVVAVPGSRPGRGPAPDLPDDLDGVRVAVVAGTAEVAAVAAEGAVAVAVPEVTGREGLPVVVGEWRLAELGLSDSGHELGKADHVWAVPPGENGWLAEVERFLLGLSHEQVTALLVAAEERA